MNKLKHDKKKANYIKEIKLRRLTLVQQ